MTFGEFKTELNSIMYDDTKVPSDDILIPKVMREMRAIAYLCEPLTLIVTSPDFKIIRDLGDGNDGVRYYLREPSLIIDNLTRVDFDKELIDALLNRVAAKISIRKKDEYMHEAIGAIAKYNFKILEAKDGNSSF